MSSRPRGWHWSKACAPPTFPQCWTRRRKWGVCDVMEQVDLRQQVRRASSTSHAGAL
jgi:hypothetical protein